MRFREAVLLTSGLNRLKAFYGQVLELPEAPGGAGRVAFQLGGTKLVFKEAGPGREPFYHIAIHIPENKFDEAKVWLKSRVALNKVEGRDEAFFENWNAHSVYFEDPAGNIVELIAHHRLNNRTEHPFSSADLLGIAEIGIATDDVVSLADQLHRLGVPDWREGSGDFAPLGDENGMFIVVREGRQWFFSDKDAEFHPVEAVVEGLGTIKFERDNIRRVAHSG
ncbi:VOC family protein [Paenibacillus thailandensis]|uniref:VOC family protein n=1 Tax=Paenibacillus thailandensis TaxID=393250 RepID=A0ABW5QW17_9BACL